MSELKCPRCDVGIELGQPFCAKCGLALKSKGSSGLVKASKGLGLLVLALVAAVFMIGVFAPMTQQPAATTSVGESTPISVQATQIAGARTPEPQAQLVNVVGFSPGDVVLFPTSGMACATTDMLREAMAHGLKGESAEMTAMFRSKEHPKALCLMLPPTMHFRVLEVFRVPADSPLRTMKVVPAVPEGKKDLAGIWSVSSGAVLVK